MVIVTVSCLPKMTQKDLGFLFSDLFKVLRANSPITHVINEEDEVILFPPDKWQYGLGQEIIAKVEGLPVSDIEGDPAVARENFGNAIRQVLKERFPSANVVCHVHPPDPRIIVCDSD